MFKRFSSNSGMSLIEIMVVLLIIGMVAFMVGPKVLGTFEKAKVQSTKTQMQNFKSALEQYNLDNGNYPTTEQGLSSLSSKPTSGTEPSNYAPGGYIDKVPLDPWNKEYLYDSDGYKYSITSLGKDRKEGGDGYNADITVEHE